MITSCNNCGKLFETNSKRTVYCSEECKKEKTRELDRIRHKSNVAEKNKYKGSTQKVVDIAVEARAHGMSYGQYAAQMYLRGEK